MLIKRFAHSCFLLQSEGGTRILTDPCDPATGYNVGPVEADCVTESHQHTTTTIPRRQRAET